MRHQLRLTTLAVAAAVSVAACGGGSDATDSTVASTEDPPTTTTTEATTTSSTEVPATSALPASTTTTSIEPTTTVAVPATTVPAVEDAVAVAAVEAQAAYLYAVYNVDAPDALNRLRATSTGDSLELGLENFQQIADNGWLVRENPDVPDRTVIASPVEILDGNTAEVTICNVGAGVVYAPGAADDGSDVIVNDLIDVSLLRVTMVLEEGSWKLASGTTVKELEGPSACDAF